jgi:hypothetical protein
MDVRSLETIINEVSGLRNNIVEHAIMCSEIALDLKMVKKEYASLKELIKTAHIMDEACNQLRQIVGNCKEHKRLPTTEEQSILNHIDPESLSTRCITEHEAFTVENPSFMKDFLKYLDEDVSSGERLMEQQTSSDELVVIRKEDYTCPITKKILECPVYNTACHHYYSEKAIKGLLSRQQQVTCPILGIAKILIIWLKR